MSTQSTLTLEEMAESLTGYEEIAVSTHFGDDVNNLLENKPTMGMRALVFTDKTRGEMNAKAAKDAALSLTLREVTEYFATDTEDVLPEEPDSESGKGD